MKQLKHVLFTGISIALIATACSKSSDSTTDETSGNWVKRSEFEGHVRSEAVAFTVGDTAYIGTGYDGINRLNDFWKYDATANQWAQRATFIGAARTSAVGFGTSTKGYIGTGYDGVNSLKDFYEYNPTTNSWAKKLDFGGSARYEAVGFAISDKGYISTGYDGNNLKDLWQYDPVLNTWTQKGSLGGDKRSSAVVFVNNGTAYICTGINNGTAVVDMWAYTAATDSWTQKRNINNVSADTYDDDYTDIVRSNAVAFTVTTANGTFAYLTDGENGTYTKKTWKYDFVNDQWTRKTPYEALERSGAVAFTVKNRGFVATGRNSTYYFDDVAEFNPDDTYNSND